ncbi:YrdB family protein [Kitasatospora sp. NPDC006697]|uniref:YrdB family protein n=1 Tax=Kitasatospora sp. NPDC006697 TaxID=3364020 RepID=UPI0036885B41
MLTALKGANAALAFLLELAVLGSVGLWGFTLSPRMPVKLLAGIGGPVLMIVLWSVFGAPGAAVSLHGVGRLLFEIAWFGAGALALFAAGRVAPAVVLAVLYAVNAVLARIWHQTN